MRGYYIPIWEYVKRIFGDFEKGLALEAISTGRWD
jgi:hypothetical protein